LRAVVVAHQRKRADGRAKFRPQRPHLFARIVGVASAYQQLVSGYGTRRSTRTTPLDALQVLLQDDSGRFDLQVVDLLINALRTFPTGCQVVLDTGEHGVVTTHLGSSRWDRPVVAIQGTKPRNVDLMMQQNGQFLHRIAGTSRHLFGDSTPSEPARAEPAEAQLLDAVLAEELKPTEDLDESGGAAANPSSCALVRRGGRIERGTSAIRS
jgi:hypothetical protein